MALSTRGIAKPHAVSPPSVSNVTVDFTSTAYTIDSLKSFGHCVSGYTGDSGDIRTAGTVRTYETALAPGLIRLGLKWDGVNNYPLNGAASGVGLGDDWVAGINILKPSGAQITGIIEGDVTVAGTSYPEMGCTPADAARLVHYYNDNGGQHGGPIQYWVIGNEPDLNATKYDYQGRQTQDGRIYGDLWLELYAAMKAADPTILIGGPTSSSFYGRVKTTISQATSPGAATQFWNDFLAASRSGVGTVANLIEFLDWHFYGTGTTYETVSTVLSRVTQGNSMVLDARAVVNAYATDGVRGSTLPAILSEFNWGYRSNITGGELTDEFGLAHDGRFSMAANTVFIATIFLNLLRQGGWGMQFGDIVGPLGLYTRNISGDNVTISGVVHHYPHQKAAAVRYPAYFGLGMWTGMGKFRRFGNNIVTTTSGITNMQILASSNTNDVMVINKDEAATRNLTITMTGIINGTNVQVWGTNRLAPWDEPTLLYTKTVSGGTISQILVPPLTVMRLIVNP